MGTQKKEPTTVMEERTTVASSAALMVSSCTGTPYSIDTMSLPSPAETLFKELASISAWK
jgi:hypothetical protein